MSLIKNENVGVNKNELEIFVDAKTFQNACKNAYFKKIKRLNVPGFRKGKAPKKVVEQIFGPGVFYETAIEMVYPKAVDEALNEAKIEIVSLEKIDPIEISEQKGFRFKAICVLKPEAEIENYKNIKINKIKKKEINDVDVDNEIQHLRQRNGRLVNVENRSVQKGDVVIIDFEGLIDGKAFEGGSSKNHSLKIGSGQFINGFEQNIEGHKVNDEFSFKIKFPDTYHVENLKGKLATFKCKLHEIKQLELPKEDDDFAKDISKFNTLEELRADIKTNLQNQVNRQEDERINNEIFNVLATNVKVQIPMVMIKNKTDELAKNFENKLAQRGLNLNKYLDMTKISGYVLESNFQIQAERQIRIDLALEKIAKLENLKVSDGDCENERIKMSKIYNIKPEQLKILFSNENLKPGLILKKALDFVKNNVEFVDAKTIQKKHDELNNSKEKEFGSDKKQSDVNFKQKLNENEKNVSNSNDLQNSAHSNVKLSKPNKVNKTTKSVKKVRTKSTKATSKPNTTKSKK